uniref:DUF1735 domain-containing protein n=1 Tax=Prevotella sp. GTC17260 TaxID=3236796 RepID=A0AB33JCQ0_9BACT
MNTKKFFYTALALMTLTTTGCEQYDNLFPDKYHSIITLQTSDHQDVTLYTTGEDGKYQLTILKGGSEPSQTATGKVTPMSEAAFATYCKTWGLDKSRLPDADFTLANADFTFTGDTSRYHHVDVTFKTDAIKALLAANPSKDYVLPLLLTSNDATVNDSLILITPSISTPTLAFKDAGVYDAITFGADDAGKKQTIDLPIVLPIDNMWNFTATVKVDEEAFKKFNKEHDNRYILLSASNYTLPANGVVTFTTDKPSVALAPSITCPDTFGDFILPLTITGSSMKGFEIREDAKTIFVHIAHNLPQISLTVDQLSSNSVEDGDGTGLAGLLDGRGSSKHYHSKWSSPVTDATYGNYIQVALKQPITHVSFEYYTRFENGNGAPTLIELFTSNDGTNWTSLGTINSGLPSKGDGGYASAVYQSATPFKYFRFCALVSRGGDMRVSGSWAYFNLGEFSLYGK